MTRPVPPLPRLTRRARLRVFLARIEGCWTGDAIGAACLFGALWVGLVLADALAGGGL